MCCLNPVCGILLVMVSLLATLASLRWWQARYSPHPEIVRKLLHVLMGGMSMSFPFLFREDWPVWVLAAASTSLLAYLKSHRQHPSGLGTVLSAVERSTHGELCFALGVSVLFSLSHNSLAQYLVPVFIMTMSDAIAAIAGIFFGRTKYKTLDGQKSAEGSLAFFLSACAGTTILVLLLTHTSPFHALLIGLLLGCLGSLFEAIAWDGLDNLFVPLASFIMLKIYLSTDISTLLLKISISILLLGVALLYRKKTKLNDSAILGAGLFSYISWATGGLTWLIAPVTVFVAHKKLLPKSYQQEGTQTIFSVLSVAGPGFFWLFLSRAFCEPRLFFFYTLSYAAHLAVISVAHLRDIFVVPSQMIAGLKAILMSWLLMFLPFLLVEGLKLSTILATLAGLIAMIFAVAIFRLVSLEEDDYQSGRRWLKQLGVVLASNVGTVVSLSLVGG